MKYLIAITLAFSAAANAQPPTDYQRQQTIKNIAEADHVLTLQRYEYKMICRVQEITPRGLGAWNDWAGTPSLPVTVQRCDYELVPVYR